MPTLVQRDDGPIGYGAIKGPLVGSFRPELSCAEPETLDQQNVAPLPGLA